MGIYRMIKKEFEFLARLYGFEIDMKQKHGSYYFIQWTHQNISIKVLYDVTVKEPITIFLYDADVPGTIFDAIEYKNEFEQSSGKPREQICRAAEWLKNAIENKTIIV